MLVASILSNTLNNLPCWDFKSFLKWKVEFSVPFVCFWSISNLFAIFNYWSFFCSDNAVMIFSLSSICFNLAIFHLVPYCTFFLNTLLFSSYSFLLSCWIFFRLHILRWMYSSISTSTFRPGTSWCQWFCYRSISLLQLILCFEVSLNG